MTKQDMNFRSISFAGEALQYWNRLTPLLCSCSFSYLFVLGNLEYETQSLMPILREYTSKVKDTSVEYRNRQKNKDWILAVMLGGYNE